MRTSSARRSKVSELRLLTGRWFKKYFSAWRPSLLGITVYKDVIYIHGENDFVFAREIEGTENFKCMVAVFDIYV